MKLLARAGVVVAVVCLTAAAATVTPAHALVPSTAPYQDATYEPTLTQLLDGTPPTGSSPPSWSWSDIWKAGEAGGRWPWLGTALGTVTLAPTAFDLGLKIGRVIDTKFLHLSEPEVCVPGSLLNPVFGCSSAATAATYHAPFIDNEKIVPQTSIGGSGLATGQYLVVEPYVTVPPAANYMCNDGLGGGLFGVSTSFYQGTGTSFANSYSGVTQTCVKQIVLSDLAVGGAIWTYFTSIGYTGVVTGTYSGGVLTGSCNAIPAGTDYTGSCYALYKDDADGEQTKHLVQAAPQTYVSQNFSKTYTMPVSPTGSMTGAQSSAARTAIGMQDPAFPDEVNCVLDPTDYGCPSGPSATDGGAKADPGTEAPTPAPSFVLPRPNPGEVYDDYAQRLRDLGYLGSISDVDADVSASPDLQPKTITRVSVLRTGGLSTEDVDAFDVVTGAPVPWPATPPTVLPASTPAIVVTSIPDSYTPGDPSSPGPTPPVGGHSIDFTPVTDLSLGCKFPYGFICYAEDVTAWFNTTPTAPVWNITVPSVTVAGVTYGPWTYGPVDLGFMDTYMGWIRTILALAIGVGTVYLVASKLLGFEGAGDPSAALEAGLHDHTSF